MKARADILEDCDISWATNFIPFLEVKNCILDLYHQVKFCRLSNAKNTGLESQILVQR